MVYKTHLFGPTSCLDLLFALQVQRRGDRVHKLPPAWLRHERLEVFPDLVRHVGQRVAPGPVVDEADHQLLVAPLPAERKAYRRLKAEKEAAGDGRSGAVYRSAAAGKQQRQYCRRKHESLWRLRRWRRRRRINAGRSVVRKNNCCIMRVRFVISARQSAQHIHVEAHQNGDRH